MIRHEFWRRKISNAGNIGRVNFLPQDGNMNSDQFAGVPPPPSPPFKINWLFSLRNETRYVTVCVAFLSENYICNLSVNWKIRAWLQTLRVVFVYTDGHFTYSPVRYIILKFNTNLSPRVIIRFCNRASSTKSTDLAVSRYPLRSPWPPSIRASARATYLMIGLSRSIDPDTGNKLAAFHGCMLCGRSWSSRPRCVLRDPSFLSPADRVGFANVNWLVNLHNA